VAWKDLLAKTEAERVVLCKHLEGRVLFTAMLRLYAALHRELRETILPARQTSTEEFHEQRRRKRNPSEEQAKKSKPATPTPVAQPRPQGEVITKNYFAPLRTAEMEVEHTPVVNSSDAPDKEPQQPARQVGRPP
jgi:hypothetical protein